MKHCISNDHKIDLSIKWQSHYDVLIGREHYKLIPSAFARRGQQLDMFEQALQLNLAFPKTLMLYVCGC